MKKKEREELHQILLEEKKRILRHLEDLSHSSEQQMDFGTGDDADIASIETSQTSLQKIGKREAFLLKKIDKALKKYGTSDFGVCEECGEDIGFPRLKARPVAQLCIDCKTEQENSEKRFNYDESAGDSSYGEEVDS